MWSKTVIRKEISQENDQEVFWDLMLVIQGEMYRLPIVILQGTYQIVQEVFLDSTLVSKETYLLTIAILQEIFLEIMQEEFSELKLQLRLELHRLPIVIHKGLFQGLVVEVFLDSTLVVL
jgi:hypothetical protein